MRVASASRIAWAVRCTYPNRPNDPPFFMGIFFYGPVPAWADGNRTILFTSRKQARELARGREHAGLKCVPVKVQISINEV